MGQPHENPTTISIFIRVIRRNIIEATPEQLKLAGYEDFIGRVCKEKIPVGSGSDMKFYQTMFEEVRRKLVLALTKDAREAVLTPSVDSDGTVQKKLTSIFRRANQLCINDSDPIQVVGTNFKGFQLMRIERQKENLATSPTFYILRGTTTLAKEHFVRAASLEALHSTLQATVFGDAALHFRVATPDELNQLISELETTYGPECSYQQYSPLG